MSVSLNVSRATDSPRIRVRVCLCLHMQSKGWGRRFGEEMRSDDCCVDTREDRRDSHPLSLLPPLPPLPILSPLSPLSLLSINEQQESLRSPGYLKDPPG